jgi:hypothetical protein
MMPALLDSAFAGAGVAVIMVIASVIAVSHFLILDIGSARQFGSAALAKIAE